MPKQKQQTLEEMMLELAHGITTGIKRPNFLQYKPNVKQERFHKSRKKGRQYIGGNRSGKTTGGIVEDLWWLTGKHPFIRTPEPPIFGRLVTVDFKQGVNQIILPQLQQWCPKSYLINGSWEDSYNSNESILKLSNGSQLQIMTYEQKLESFAGVPRHFIHFDEEPPQAIFEECKLRLVDTNGRWWITETPVEGMTWTYEEVYQPGVAGDPLIEVIEAEIWDNYTLSQEAIDDALSGLDEDMRKIRGSGKYVAIGGAIFPHWNKDRVLDCSERRWIPPKDWAVYESFDHGFNNPTAWHWHAVSPNGTVVTFDEHYKKGMVVEQHCDVVKEKEAELRKYGVVPYLRIGDPAIKQRNAVTGLSIQIEYAQRDLNIVTGNNEVKAGLDKMNEYMLQNRWYVTSNCRNLINEIPKYRWKPWMSPKMKDRNNPMEEPLKKDDHGIDGCRYFFSFMPDLEPIRPQDRTPLTREQVASIMGAGTTFDPRKPFRTDPSFEPQPKFNEFPDITFVDEYMGGEW